MSITTLQPFNLDPTKDYTFGNVSATSFTGNVNGTISSATTAGTVTTNAQPNITSTGTLTGLTVTDTITGNITGSAGTVTTNAQPNITSVGTLSSLTVTANITSGNLTTGGQVVATGNITGNNISTSRSFLTKTILETVTINANAFPSGTSNYDLLTQSVWYSTANAGSNFVVNIRGNSTVTANSLLSVGQSASFALLVTNGSTAYVPATFLVDGNFTTVKYQNGTTISTGNANSIDAYSCTLIKTAATPTYVLLLTQTKFA